MSEVEEEVEQECIVVPGPAAIPIPIGLINNLANNQFAQFTNTSAIPITPNLSVPVNTQLTLLTGPPTTLPTGLYTYSVLFNYISQPTVSVANGYQSVVFTASQSGKIMITVTFSQGLHLWQGNFMLNVTLPTWPLREDTDSRAGDNGG